MHGQRLCGCAGHSTFRRLFTAARVCDLTAPGARRRLTMKPCTAPPGGHQGPSRALSSPLGTSWVRTCRTLGSELGTSGAESSTGTVKPVRDAYSASDRPELRLHFWNAMVCSSIRPRPHCPAGDKTSRLQHLCFRVRPQDPGHRRGQAQEATRISGHDGPAETTRSQRQVQGH